MELFGRLLVSWPLTRSCISVDSNVGARARSLTVEKECDRGRRLCCPLARLEGGTGTPSSHPPIFDCTRGVQIPDISLSLSAFHAVLTLSPSEVPGGVTGPCVKFCGGMRLGLRYSVPAGPTFATVKCLGLGSSSAVLVSDLLSGCVLLGTLIISLLSFAVRILPDAGRKISWVLLSRAMCVGGFAGSGASCLRFRASALRSMSVHEACALCMHSWEADASTAPNARYLNCSSCPRPWSRRC